MPLPSPGTASTSTSSLELLPRRIRRCGTRALHGEHVRGMVAVVDALEGHGVARTLDLPYLTAV